VRAAELNAFDVLWARHVVFVDDAWDVVGERLPQVSERRDEVRREEGRARHRPQAAHHREGHGPHGKQNGLHVPCRADANKSEIKRAVEELFKVTVLGVRTMVRSGKLKGRAKMKRACRTGSGAVVTLKAGDSVEFL
jgi:large subunit ribosomal protein L23